MVFLPRDPQSRLLCEELFTTAVQRTGQKVLGWRDVPTNNSEIGNSAKAVEPVFRQVFIAAVSNAKGHTDFEGIRFVTRARAKNAVAAADIKDGNYFYLSSLSCSTLIYKGMLSAEQMETYFPDLKDPLLESALAVVHQRFSTNTFPSWPL